MDKLNKHQHGMSLIEIMIAMVIGLLLLSGAGTMFMSNQRVYREQNETGLLQENARFLMELLNKDIRRAAFVGCSDEIADVSNNLGAVATSIKDFSAGNLLEGSENGSNWLPSNSSDAVANIVAGTDGITVRYFQPTGVTVTDEMVGAGADIKTDGSGGLVTNSYLAIADCGGADIFKATNVVINDADNTDATFSHTGLSRTYSTGSELYKLANHRYFIAESTTGSGPALWRVTPGTDDSAAGTGEELIEGVENLQILYGEDTDSDGIANSFLEADSVANGDNIVSVKIGLLMRTVDENKTNDIDDKIYSVLGTNIGPINDKHRRRIFTSTIQIRNRR